MNGVIGQKGFHQLPESQIKKERSTVRSRPGAHFGYFKVGHLPNDFVNGKILPWQDGSGGRNNLLKVHVRLYRHQRHRS
jgi:hypothetical protein